MNQQRAIGTLAGQRQAVTIARFLIWYTREGQVLSDRPERKLAILGIACESVQNDAVHEAEAGDTAFFSVFAPSFRPLFSFPFRSPRQPKRYIDLWRAACPGSARRHRQIPDEKHVGFLPCVRIPGQAHLPETTRLARLHRYLIPDPGSVSTTNVNSSLTPVVALYRRLRYTFLDSVFSEEKCQGHNYHPSSCWRRSIGTTRPGGDPVPIGASRELRYSVLDFPGEESYSFQKAENAPCGLVNRRARCF